MNPAPSIFEPTLTLNHLLFKNKLTGTSYTFHDFFYLNREGDIIRNKTPEWLCTPIVTTPRFPDGVEFALKALRLRPADAAPSLLHRDIVLSYFGNAAKSELEKIAYRVPDIQTQHNASFPWTVVEKLAGVSKALLYQLRYNGRNISDQDLVAHLILQQYGANSTSANKLYKFMLDSGIPLPLAQLKESDPLGIKLLQTRITIDPDTGKILALEPPPVQPLSTADVSVNEKKTSEVPSQSSQA